ncbi:MAG: hypothetical protein QY318_04615 [Candidatus Dojkabacteria bacterium]|nr:MAG: hypothetical protein QY318_04615 [Candidatus Dojkabacteria bacterium]
MKTDLNAKPRLVKFTQILLVILNSLLLIGVICWPILNRTNHTGLEAYYFIVPFFIVALLLLLSSPFSKELNVTLLGVMVSLLGVALLFTYKQYNVMINYNEWLTRGMPSRFESVETMFWANDNETSYSAQDLSNSNFLVKGFGITLPEPYVMLSSGAPVKVDICNTISASGVDVYLEDRYLQDTASFRISIEEKEYVQSNSEFQEFVRVFLPQSAGEFEKVGSVDLNGHVFTKYKYNSYEIVTPVQFELVGEEYIYEIELDDIYLFISHISISDNKIEEILSTLKTNDLDCQE